MTGGYPCCCLPGGSTLPGSSDDDGGGIPPTSSEGGAGGDVIRGSSFADTFTCTAFASGVAPSVLRVEVHGVGSLACADCPLLDGVYFVVALPLGLPDRCLWELAFPPVCDFFDLVRVEMFEAAIGSYAWSVYLSDRPVSQGQEVLQFGGPQTTSGAIEIADVDNVVLDVLFDTNNTRCELPDSAFAVISAVT